MNVVAYSSGWESTYCALWARRQFNNVSLCFVDWGQAYLYEERHHARAFAARLGFVLHERSIVVAMDRTSRVVAGRNAAILHACAAVGASSLTFGSRGLLSIFDTYKDSNAQWAAVMSVTLAMKVHTPATLMLKCEIKRSCRRMFADVDRYVFSSEGLSSC